MLIDHTAWEVDSSVPHLLTITSYPPCPSCTPTPSPQEHVWETHSLCERVGGERLRGERGHCGSQANAISLTLRACKVQGNLGYIK